MLIFGTNLYVQDELDFVDPTLYAVLTMTKGLKRLDRPPSALDDGLVVASLTDWCLASLGQSSHPARQGGWFISSGPWQFCNLRESPA